jgi:hypothetical protein
MYGIDVLETLHHLQACDELPAELIIHPRIVVSRNSTARSPSDRT